MTPILEFLIAMLLVFVLLSTLVSSLQEFYSSHVGKNFRSVLLYESLLKALSDRTNRNFTDDLYRHPLVSKSKPDDHSLPSYVDDRVFATAITDIFIRDARKIFITYDANGKPVVNEPEISPEDSFKLFREGVSALHTSELKRLLQTFIASSNGTLPGLKIEIETWYNAYMDRVTGWYKARIKRQLFWTSLLVTLFLNIDLFRLAGTVWGDERLRTSLVAQALERENAGYLDACEDLTGDERIACLKERVDSTYRELKLTGLPLGWIRTLPDEKMPAASEGGGIGKWLGDNLGYFWALVKYNWEKFMSITTIVGWVLMAFLLTQGAPFWFEMMTRLINIRGAGTRPAPAKGAKP